VLPVQAPAGPLHHTITVDGSYGFARKVAGVGLVIQQSDRPRRRGQVVDAIAEAFVGVPAGHVEALAVLRALEIAAERAFCIVKIRSDHNQLRRTLREHHQSQDTEVRDGLQGVILRLARGFDEVTFSYVPRRKNQQAHKLARRAVHEAAPRSRLDLFPSPPLALRAG